MVLDKSICQIIKWWRSLNNQVVFYNTLSPVHTWDPWINCYKQISAYECRICRQQDIILVSEAHWFPFVVRLSGLRLHTGKPSVWRSTIWEPIDHRPTRIYLFISFECWSGYQLFRYPAQEILCVVLRKQNKITTVCLKSSSHDDTFPHTMTIHGAFIVCEIGAGLKQLSPPQAPIDLRSRWRNPTRTSQRRSSR